MFLTDFKKGESSPFVCMFFLCMYVKRLLRGHLWTNLDHSLLLERGYVSSGPVSKQILCVNYIIKVLKWNILKQINLMIVEFLLTVFFYISYIGKIRIVLKHFSCPKNMWPHSEKNDNSWETIEGVSSLNEVSLSYNDI